MKTIREIWTHMSDKILADVPLTADAKDMASAVFFTGAKVSGTAGLEFEPVWLNMRDQFVAAGIDDESFLELLEKVYTAGGAGLNLIMAQEKDDKQARLDALLKESTGFLVAYEQRHSTEH